MQYNQVLQQMSTSPSMKTRSSDTWGFSSFYM